MRFQEPQRWLRIAEVRGQIAEVKIA